jgi:hypothetical protein
MHLVLLGDSVFDNGHYVDHGMSVTDHLKRILPEDASVTCLAVDGHLTGNVFYQLDKLPPSATHVALSSGGNDALAVLPYLDLPCSTIADALKQLSVYQQKFQKDYWKLKQRLEDVELPLLVCTIYDAVPGLPTHLRTALSLFNDVITRAAHDDLNDILDLRTCLNQESDFSLESPIEPSSTGGEKIVRHLVGWALETHRHW